MVDISNLNREDEDVIDSLIYTTIQTLSKLGRKDKAILSGEEYMKVYDKFSKQVKKNTAEMFRTTTADIEDDIPF